ncbi:Molybdopterin-guanine dinucleotide biosynthesis protein MobA [Minicystis rosea]|nr:Molybdopterin-guanine dinucleotide biosynthesis protein MobA [Minicystis rosea]
MSATANLGGVILCGGKSSRMGTPKAWLDFDGEPLLARTVRVVSEVAAPVVVVAALGQALPPLPNDVTIVRDAVEGRGPLQGIAAGLEALAERAHAAFVSSTDAPFLHPAMIRRLAALHGDAHDIVVPQAQGHFHPLCAVYGLQARAEIASLLAADRLRLSLLFERMRTLVADEVLLLADEALRAADPTLRSLCNVNTPEEYAAALADRR